MKNIIKIGTLALCLAVGLSSCNDFFDAIPGEQYDLDDTFTNRLKTEQFLNNVYNYVPDETLERSARNTMSGIWTTGSLECKLSWDGNNGSEWASGATYAGSSWINFWYIEYYKGISRASTFIMNVDRCLEASAAQRKQWKAQARALRAFYYFMIFRSYGPFVILGEEPIPLDISTSELLKERNTVDECVDFMTKEFDNAANDLPDRYDGSNLGRMDRAACKAFKAKMLLYAASPLFNCNADYVGIVNPESGKQLFPQDKSQEKAKWKAARDAYKAFFDEYGNTFSLYTETTSDGKVDFYESYRKATSGVLYGAENKEQIFIRLADHDMRAYETTPYHKGYDDNNGALRGGLGFGVPQEMVDLYFMKDGRRIVDDENYKEYEGVPSSEYLGWSTDYKDAVVNTRTYFKANSNKTLKQWADREPRFYANITFNGSTWLKTDTPRGEVTTELTFNGNSGYANANWDTPYTGYGMRKMAPKEGRNGANRHCATLLRLADMYLGYAETLSACDQRDEAIKYVNKVRARAGIPGYGAAGTTDDNGFACIPYEDTRDGVDKRIRRERLIELMFEWNHFFDVRRWKVANMAVGDDWIYPNYHRGGEGGAIHGMAFRSDAPVFFEKVVVETRTFLPKHYLFPIPDEDVRRNPKMVQNLGWTTE